MNTSRLSKKEKKIIKGKGGEMKNFLKNIKILQALSRRKKSMEELKKQRAAAIKLQALSRRKKSMEKLKNSEWLLSNYKDLHDAHYLLDE